MGRPQELTIAWIFVVRPPRERPIACASAPLFRPPPSGEPWLSCCRWPGHHRGPCASGPRTNDAIVRASSNDGTGCRLWWEDHSRTEDFYSDLIARRPGLLDERLKLHALIIDEFNLAALEKLPPDELSRQVRTYVGNYARDASLTLNQKELDIFSNEIIDEMRGYGPIEPLLKDPTVSDILINTHKRCFVERFGQLQETKIHFKDEAHLLRIVNKIVSAVGRSVDESSPMVDARLPDGSRVNVAVRPVAVDGPLISIRKFAERAFNMERLVDVGALRPAMVEVLAAAVQGKTSAIISGGTGSGKTTLLNALSHYIPSRERLLTIEDAAELQLQQPHVGRMETRPANIEGKGEVRQRDLLKNALRMPLTASSSASAAAKKRSTCCRR